MKKKKPPYQLDIGARFWNDPVAGEVASSLYLPSGEEEQIQRDNISRQLRGRSYVIQGTIPTKFTIPLPTPSSEVYDETSYEERRKRILASDKLTDKRKAIALKTLATKSKKDKDNWNKVMKCEKKELTTLTPKQKQELLRWFDQCDRIYNHCVRKGHVLDDRNKTLIKKALDLTGVTSIENIEDLNTASQFLPRSPYLLTESIDDNLQGLFSETTLAEIKKAEEDLARSSSKTFRGLFYESTLNGVKDKLENMDLNFMTLRKKIFSEILGQSEQKRQKMVCPHAVLADEVRVYCSNLKSCLTNKKNGNIPHFQLRERQSRRDFKTLLIPSKSVIKGGFYKSYLGPIKNFRDLVPEKVTCDCRLVYDRKAKKFYLTIPRYHDKKLNPDKKPLWVGDPGEVVFMSYYAMDEYGYMGENMKIPLLKYRNAISVLQRILSKRVNKKGQPLRNRRRLKERINAYHRRIRNLVKELHNQIAIHLCRTYHTIMIPKFATQDMVSHKTQMRRNKEMIQKITSEEKDPDKIKERLKMFSRRNRLNAKVSFVLNALSHYKFQQHLLHKAEEHGCRVVFVTEEYTSKTCGRCGRIGAVFKEREKRCDHCGYRMNRDINGARNILIKNWSQCLEKTSVDLSVNIPEETSPEGMFRRNAEPGAIVPEDSQIEQNRNKGRKILVRGKRPKRSSKMLSTNDCESNNWKAGVCVPGPETVVGEGMPG